MVDTVVVERSGGGGGLGSIVLLVAVGALGLFLWKYLNDDGSSQPPTQDTCINVGTDTKCVEGVHYTCKLDTDGVKRFAADGSCSTPIGSGYPCTRCRDLGCTQTFATEDLLKDHIEECHYSVMTQFFPITRVWTNTAVATRPVSLRYFFCQPYNLKEVYAEFQYVTMDDYDPVHQLCLLDCGWIACGGCCDCYVRVYYWNFATSKRTLLAEYRIPRRSGGQPAVLQKVCDVTTDMIEFELHGRGSLCGDLEDPQFRDIAASFTIGGPSTLGVPKVCSSAQVGWYPFLVRNKDWIGEVLSGNYSDVLPAAEAYHTGEAHWVLCGEHDKEAKPSC